MWLFGLNCAVCTIVHYVVHSNDTRFAEKFPRAVKAKRESHYRDNWLDSFKSECEALQVAKDVKYIHSRNEFEMINWNSNRVSVIEAHSKIII